MELKEIKGKKYYTEQVLCPECGGECKVEKLTGLSYTGEQTWKKLSCQNCDASGTVIQTVRCDSCGDEIEENDLVTFNGGNVKFRMHTGCRDAEE